MPLTLGGRLSATVLDRATGKGVRLACLVLVEPAAGVDIDGRYKLTSLGPYEWPIFVKPIEGPEGPDAPRQWSGGTGNRYQAETVAVRSGETSTLDITTQPFAAIAGAVTAPEGGVLIASNASTGDEVGWARFAGLGEYRLPLVGGQRVVVRWVLNSGRSGVWAEGEKVQVPKADTRALDLTIG
ncbi:MAG: hypothetical protein ABW000_07975 [Actinoplanes sp.]